MSLENLVSQWDMRSRPQKQYSVANCQQTQRKSIRNYSMLPNITYAHTHTHIERVILHQVSHTVFKSWNMLNPHTDAATYTHTCCDSLLYLRSAGLQWIVIDLCWWAVWGFLSTESSLCVLLFSSHTHTHTYISTLHQSDAPPLRPHSFISIFMAELWFEVHEEVNR